MSRRPGATINRGAGVGEGRAAAAGCVILVVRPEAAHWALWPILDAKAKGPRPATPRTPYRGLHTVPVIGPRAHQSNGWSRAQYGPRSRGPQRPIPKYIQRATCATRCFGTPTRCALGPCGQWDRRVIAWGQDHGPWPVGQRFEQFNGGPRTGACAPYAEPISL